MVWVYIAIYTVLIGLWTYSIENRQKGLKQIVHYIIFIMFICLSIAALTINEQYKTSKPDYLSWELLDMASFFLPICIESIVIAKLLLKKLKSKNIFLFLIPYSFLICFFAFATLIFVGFTFYDS